MSGAPHEEWAGSLAVSEKPVGLLRSGLMSPALWRVVAYVLIAASAFNGSLGTVLGRFSFRPDWFLSAGAVLLLISTGPWRSVEAWRHELRNPVSVGLLAFVLVHVATSVVNAGRWPLGLKFMNVYVLGLAAFLVVLRGIQSRHTFDVAVRLLIAIAVFASVWGGLAAITANMFQLPVVGAGPMLYLEDIVVYAGQGGLLEWNILGSFLLTPFALSLWYWSERPPGRFPFRGAALAIVFGLVATQTRAAWLASAAIAFVWLWLRRPTLAAFGSVVGVAVLSTLVFQASLLPALRVGAFGDGVHPNLLRLRLLNPLVQGQDYNLRVRQLMNAAVLDDWRTSGPVGWLLGRGSGSTNAIDMIKIDGRPAHLDRMWTGNAFLINLHDAGLAGLVVFTGLVTAVARQLRSMLQRARSRQERGLCHALIVSAVSLLFAYQFTHALWQMSTYVFLGLVVVGSRILDADTTVS